MRGHADPGCGQPSTGQRPHEGGPNPTVPWVTPAWEVLLPFSRRRAPPPRTSQGVLGGGMEVLGQTYYRAAPWWRSHCSWRSWWPPRHTPRSWSPPHGCRACCPSLWGTGRAGLSPGHRASPRGSGEGRSRVRLGAQQRGRVGSWALTWTGVAEPPWLLRLGVKAVPLLALVPPGQHSTRMSGGPGGCCSPHTAPSMAPVPTTPAWDGGAPPAHPPPPHAHTWGRWR